MSQDNAISGYKDAIICTFTLCRITNRAVARGYSRRSVHCSAKLGLLIDREESGQYVRTVPCTFACLSLPVSRSWRYLARLLRRHTERWLTVVRSTSQHVQHPKANMKNAPARRQRSTSDPALAKRMASRTPHYQRLLDELISRVKAGTYPVGSLLPTEHQLCEEFDLSRFTVREALRRMTDMGMLVRVTRKGTRVISDHPGTAYVQPLDSIEEVMMHVRDTHLNVVSVDMLSVDPALAEQLGCKPGETWLRISGLRQTRDKQLPLSWTDIYVVERYSGIMGDLKSSNKAIYELIEARYGEKIAEIEQEISATNVQAAMALALQVRPGSPALLVIRRAFNERGDVIEISVNTQPASRYTFSLRVGRHRTSVRQTLSSESAT